MRVLRRSTVLVLAMAVAGADGAAAQARETAPLLLELPANTRAAGLGNAYVQAGADADALFYNPGLLDTARGLGGSIAFYGRATLFTVAAAGEWWRGGAAVGVQALSYSAPTVTTGAFLDGEAGLSTQGGAVASETVASAGYARVLFGFRAGIVAKLAEQRVQDERDVTVAADVGLARRIGRVTLGLAVQNVGRQPEFDGRDVDLPRTISLGAGTQSAVVGPFDVTLAARLAVAEEEQLTASAGVEVAYWPVNGRTFIVRAGFRHMEDDGARPLTLGAGFTGDRIALDWAVQDFARGEAVHRVGVRWR